MKTINLELSQKLAPYLEEIGTEYAIDKYCEVGEVIYAQSENDTFGEDGYYKTLTLEEAIEFLPISIPLYKTLYSVTYGTNGQIFNGVKTYYTQLSTSGYRIEKRNEGKTLLEAIEKMLEYLLDNNLLG